MSLLNNASLIFGVLVIIFALTGVGQTVELVIWLNDKSVRHKKKIRREYLETIPQCIILSLGWILWGSAAVYYSLVHSFGWVLVLIGSAIAIRFIGDIQSDVTRRYERLRRDFLEKSTPPQENIPEEP